MSLMSAAALASALSFVMLAVMAVMYVTLACNPAASRSAANGWITISAGGGPTDDKPP